MNTSTRTLGLAALLTGGLAGQAGVDFKVADHYFINADVKYIRSWYRLPLLTSSRRG